MKLYEEVELMRDRAEYADACVKKGDKGVILMDEERNGYILVGFYGDDYDGDVWTDLNDVGVRIEDLRVSNAPENI